MDRRREGRLVIDLEVEFMMQMAGFFEGITSDREIAMQCADSLSIRQLLDHELPDATPGYSSLTVIRKRLAPEV